jgi:endonuclease G, mitochondrial
MAINNARIEESLRRAAALGLDERFKELGEREGIRRARPAQIAGRKMALVEWCADESIAARRRERVLKGNALTDVNDLRQGLLSARAVGRVVVRLGERTVSYGTGSLVAPGVMLTNQHALESVQVGTERMFQLGYERDLRARSPASGRWIWNCQRSRRFYHKTRPPFWN